MNLKIIYKAIFNSNNNKYYSLNIKKAIQTCYK